MTADLGHNLSLSPSRCYWALVQYVGRGSIAAKKDRYLSRDSEVMNGMLVLAGTRVPVEILIQHLTAGDSLDTFLDDFPTVSREQAVAFLNMTLEIAADRHARYM